MAIARHLGLWPSRDPVAAIIDFCEVRVGGYLRESPDCRTLSQLLEITARREGLHLIEIRGDEDLARVCLHYAERGEPSFPAVAAEFDDQLYGITFRLAHPRPGELPYFAIIDARGEKAARAWFTKWHETGHLLILGGREPQALRPSPAQGAGREAGQRPSAGWVRTHAALSGDEAEEILVDMVAGACAFHREVVRRHARGPLGFAALRELRESLCPEASQQASRIGFVHAWPHPCLLLHCQPAARRSEEAFGAGAARDLRATHVTPNAAARARRLSVFANMRVPAESVIRRVYEGQIQSAEADEDLSWWSFSSGARLPRFPVRVEAEKSWKGVDALFVPLAASPGIRG